MLVVRIDINSHSKIHATSFITRKLKLKIWTQAVALKGCFFFAAALISSQFIGHYVIHRALNGATIRRYAEVEQTIYATAPLNSLMRRSKGCKLPITILIIASLAGLLLGICLPFLHLEYAFKLHINQWLVNEQISEYIVETYNILTAAVTMSEVNHIGGENVGLSILTLAFVVVAPLLRALFSLLLWIMPMRAGMQRAFAGVIDYLSVVAAADVFGVSAFIMIWQLPKIYSNMEEAAEYMTLSMNSCAGLHIFTAFGFLETFVSKAIHERYMQVIREESEGALRVAGSGVVDIESQPPIANVVRPGSPI